MEERMTLKCNEKNAEILENALTTLDVISEANGKKLAAWTPCPIIKLYNKMVLILSWAMRLGLVDKTLKADVRVPSSRLGSGAWCISVKMTCRHSWSAWMYDYIILCNRKEAI